MIQSRSTPSFMRLAGLGLLLLVSCFPAAYSEAATVIARAIITSGEVSVRTEPGDYRPLSRRSAIYAGDTVITGPDSRAQLRFIDGAILALEENSELAIDEYHYQHEEKADRAAMRLMTGGLRTLTGRVTEKDPEAYELQTPLASIGIRGTDYQVALSEDRLVVGVWSGRIQVSNTGGRIDLGGDRDFRFAVVNTPTRAPLGQLQPPAELQQGLPVTPKGDADSSASETSSGSDDEANESSHSETTDDQDLQESPSEEPIEFHWHETEETVAPLPEDHEQEEAYPPLPIEEEEPDPPLPIENGDEEAQSWVPAFDRRGLITISDSHAPSIQGKSNTLTNEADHFVVETDAGYLLSLETAGLAVIEYKVKGFPVNWGIWNGEPDIFIHEDEYDAGRIQETLEAPALLASFNTLLFEDIIAARPGQDMLTFESGLALLGFASNDALAETGSHGRFDLNLNTGDITDGFLNIALESSNEWHISFYGYTSGSWVSLTNTGTYFLDNSGPEPYQLQGTGGLDGQFTATHDMERVGLLGEFYLETDNALHSTHGLFLLEEAPP